MASFEELVSTAESAPFQGWDFSFLKGRYLEARPGWSYRALVSSKPGGAKSLLDLGTGGGEFLSSLGPIPEVACATEGYRPNTKVASAALNPLGVAMVETRCDDNRITPQRGELPFRDRAFDLVIDRHESYVTREVRRVLGTNGVFITQQVGDEDLAEVHNLFRSPPRESRWDVGVAKEQLEEAGMRVEASGSWSGTSRFLDVGALVYLLRAVPWEVPSFSSTRFESELRHVHTRIKERGTFEVTAARFYVVGSRE